jgi:hypothetical protein
MTLCGYCGQNGKYFVQANNSGSLALFVHKFVSALKCVIYSDGGSSGDNEAHVTHSGSAEMAHKTSC